MGSNRVPTRFLAIYVAYRILLHRFRRTFTDHWIERRTGEADRRDAPGEVKRDGR
jgi:hypothetical protein